jgi:catechol 2,3-dioxygenase-like lactoylglutathione lyase family enzyme
VTPQLAVRDLDASLRFYRDVLGAEVVRLRSDFASVRLGPAEIFLSAAATPAAPACCCVLVDDADALFALYRERGARMLEPPADRPWGVREFTLEDLDGHRFRIGHSTR